MLTIFKRNAAKSTEIEEVEVVETKAKLPVTRPLLPITKPLALKYEVEAVPSDYVELCTKVGYRVPSELRDQQFQKFLFDNEIPLYDTRQVNDYLVYLLGNVADSDKRFCWRGLRKSDGRPIVVYLTCDGNYRNYFADRGTDPYDKIIPSRVLKTVSLIQESYPEAKFYVSDVYVDPDPFAMVDIGTGRIYVFAVWNEPGFSG